MTSAAANKHSASDSTVYCRQNLVWTWGLRLGAPTRPPSMQCKVRGPVPQLGHASPVLLKALPVVTMHLCRCACTPCGLVYSAGQWPVDAIEWNLSDGTLVDISLQGKRKAFRHTVCHECTPDLFHVLRIRNAGVNIELDTDYITKLYGRGGDFYQTQPLAL